MILKQIPHQLEAVKIAERMFRYLYADPTGAGKTIEQLMIIDRWKDRPWVVILPFGVIESWLDKVEKFFPHLKIFTVKSSCKAPYYKALCEKWGIPKGTVAQCKQRLMECCDAVLINPEQVKKYASRFSGIGEAPWNLIVDESDILGSPTSQISKFVLKEFKKAQRGYLFSATPADTVFQLYTQVKYMDPTIFPYSYTKFKQLHGILDVAGTRAIQKRGGYGQVYRPNPESWDFVKEKTKHLIRWLDKETIMPWLPPLTEEVYTIPTPKDLPKPYRWDLAKAKKAYKESPEGFLENVMSYREVASGFLYHNEEVYNRKKDKYERKRRDDWTEYFKHGKIEALKYWLNKWEGEKVVVWIAFVEEADMILQAFGRSQVAFCCNHKHSSGNTNEIEYWKEHARILLAHHKTIGRGLDGLQHFCCKEIAYSPIYEAKVFEQMRDRLHRNGQESPVTMVKFSTIGTIEPSIWKANESKQKFTDFLKEK